MGMTIERSMMGGFRVNSRVALVPLALPLLALAFMVAPSASRAAVSCPNEAVRVGPSASLPDCRAYELVTPSDVNGRVLVPITIEAERDGFPTDLQAAGGNNFIYLTYNRPLLAPGGAGGIFDVYEAARRADGWETLRRRSPDGYLQETSWAFPGGMDESHGFAFSRFRGAPGGTLLFPDNSLQPIAIGSLGTEPLAQGRYISPGGEHIIFSTGSIDSGGSIFCRGGCVIAQLEPNAPPAGTGAIYDRTPTGPTKVVSLLPSNLPPAAGQDARYQGASHDGSVVAFKIEGTLYVRIDNTETKEVTSGAASFAGLSSDGSYLFYVSGGDKGTIRRFDTRTGADVAINPTAEGQVVNVSADGSHVYFISEDQIEGEGLPLQPNLYVWSDDAAASAHPVRHIATVVPTDLQHTSGDLEPPVPSLTAWTPVVNNPSPPSAVYKGIEQGPGADSSRTTPHGDVLVFESRAKLTSYDNGGHTEIYRYSAADSIQCLSCNPLQAPTGDAHLENLKVLRAGIVIHNLSEDGTRVFFETPEGLVGRDTDGINDIYQWHEGGETGSVDLISSGHSVEYKPVLLPGFEEEAWFPRANTIFSVTPSGSDVFFQAQDELVEGSGRGGTSGIYDARINGGFPKSPAPQACTEEGCRPAPQAAVPVLPAPRSEAAGRSGNINPHKHRCHRRHRYHRRYRHCAKAHCRVKTDHSKHRRCGRRRNHRSRAHASAVVQQGTAAPVTDEGPVGTQATTTASAEITPEPFGIRLFGAKLSTAVAGAHPDFTTNIVVNHEGTSSKDLRQKTESLTVDLPPGLVGNPKAVPQCKMGEAVAFMACSPASQVGLTKVFVADFGSKGVVLPVFNVEPPHPDREIARLGFLAGTFPAFIDIHVRTAGDFGVTATVEDSPGLTALLEAETVLWGNPAASSHDENRVTTVEAFECNSVYFEPGIACEQPGHRRESAVPPAERKAFLTNSSACEPAEVGLAATSYQLPGQTFTASAPLAPITDCSGLPFAPSFEAEPTSHEAGAPTGLKSKLTLPQHLGEDERATATMREARVTLPEGMQVAAGAANWIGTCSDEQVGYHEEVETKCPDNAKLGTATIISPALSTPIEGTIYQRSPQLGRQFGLWLTADALGLHIKLPGSLEPDEQSGRLTAVFSDLPQVPVEEIDLNVWGGKRAPLQNPDHCGAFTADFSISPHSNDPAATGQSTTQISEGCNQGFDPTLHAGVTNPVAGKYSPFVFDLTRSDGQQALRGFELKLPDGELAKLKGVPLCPDANASAGTCPAGSRIGHLQATTGPGPEPFTLPEPGKAEPQIYLAGPYKDAPFSIVSEVPAQAGPFDLGTLVVRSGLAVEPETGRAVVKADPLPQFFEGVGIAYRNLHAIVDRPEFSLNPTDCREMAVNSDVTSTQGTVAHPAARFQVDGCKALKFKPKLSLKLRGGTKRADYPALTAVLKARKGDANIAFTSVALPHSEFLAQEHIGTICTRKQFAADKCPKGSVYGKAKALTPLLDKPLSGPVYLRSSNHPLPDLVAKLGGQLEIDLVGRIDSKNGGIRTTFESVPDAPVSKFVLKMKGGRKGLLANSTDICLRRHRASVELRAQNGRAVVANPSVTVACKGKRR
jgi:hypothetical protein